MVLHLARSWCISFEKLKWSTRLVYSVFFCHFKSFYCHWHSKCLSSGPSSLDSNAFETFIFFFLKKRYAHIFSVLAPVWVTLSIIFSMLCKKNDMAVGFIFGFPCRTKHSPVNYVNKLWKGSKKAISFCHWGNTYESRQMYNG